MGTLLRKLLGQDGSDSQSLPAVARRHNFCVDIPAATQSAGGLAGSLQGEAFLPGQSYFSIRLVGMQLAADSNLLSDFLPLCTCFLRYTYASEKQELPFIVGYEQLRKVLGDNVTRPGGRHIDFRDIYICRNIPFMADGVEMYTALSRVSDSSLVRGMLDLLAVAVGEFGGATGKIVVNTGRSLLDPLGKLIGAEGVNVRFGTYDGSALERSGYRIFGGSDFPYDMEKLQVIDNRLFLTQDDGTVQPVDNTDYLILALEYHRTLVSDPASIMGTIANMSFHKNWKTVLEGMRSKNDTAAQEAMGKLCMEVALSPELTPEDHLTVMSGYHKMYSAYREQFNLLRGPTESLSTILSGIRRTQSPAVNNLLTEVRNTIENRIASPGVAVKSLQSPALDLNDETFIISLIQARESLDLDKHDTASIMQAKQLLTSAVLGNSLGLSPD